MPAPGERGDRRFAIVGWLATGVLTLLLVVMLGRVVQLQLFPPLTLLEHSPSHARTRSEAPLRGDVLDRRGRPLAVTRFGQRLVVDPLELKGHADAAIAIIADALGEPGDRFAPRILGAVESNTARESFNALLAADPANPALPAMREQLAGAAPAGQTLQAGKLEPLPLKRYLSMTDVLAEDKAQAVAAALKPSKKPNPALAGIWLEQRPVREFIAGDSLATLVGKVGVEEEGLTGVEHRRQALLAGTGGKVSYVADAGGRPLWIEPGHVTPARAGGDLRLSIDLELQRLAVQELQRGIDETDAAGGRLVMLDPRSGEVLAMVDLTRSVPDAVDYPWIDAATPRAGDETVPERRYRVMPEDKGRQVSASLARNRCVEDVYEPGSTFKPFVWSVITELGRAQIEEIFDTENGRWHNSYGRYIEDVTKRPRMSWAEVLINSSNIGMVKASERLSFAELAAVPRRFGFGQRTGIDLPGEASGIVTPLSRWSKFTQTSVAYGHEVAVTPVQMVRAFSAFARTGELAGTLPTVRLAAAQADDLNSSVLYRVLPAQVATLTRRTMRGVAEKMEGALATATHTKPSWRYSMFGKSGTAKVPLGAPPKGKRAPKGSKGYYEKQYNSSFIAGAPLEEPRLVVLAVIDDPGPALTRTSRAYGALVAGPVVRRVMERALTYLGVPPDLAPAGDEREAHDLAIAD